MILASRAASRIGLGGCAAGLAALALALGGCGGDTPANARDTPISSAEKTAAKQRQQGQAQPREREPSAPAAGKRCRAQVGDFLDAMSGLRERLVTGLSYEEYVGEVGVIRAVYDEVPVQKLSLPCLSSSGTPGELGFDRYIEAANSWGGCIEAEDCDAAKIEPVLQKHWRRASLLLDEARSGLGV